MSYSIILRRVWALLLMLTATAAANDGSPNILLIMADDVGSDAVGCYGGRSFPTPHIDDLAAGGMKFNHAYSMPVCHPSRICLLTGRYPFRFGEEGSQWGDFPAEGEAISIANRLGSGGYATAVAGKWQLCLMKNDLYHPQRLGFDRWSLFGWHEGARYHDPWIYENGQLRDDTTGKFGPDLYVQFLIDFMRECQQSKTPFFAFYSMALCHDVTDDLGDRHVAYYKDGRWMNFAEMMAAMDDMVGRLVSALDELGIRDETLILFTTDNGTAGATYLKVDEQTGRMLRFKNVTVRDDQIIPGGKGKLDDSGTRVPLIANWPGHIQSGQRTDVMVDLTDLLPTFADIADLSSDGVARDGISFAPVMLDQTDQPSTRSWVYLAHRGQRCVRSRNWKLYDDGRFFEVRSDPRENEPLGTAQLDQKARRAKARLSEALNELTGPLP